jgi:hypothetical protein
MAIFPGSAIPSAAGDYTIDYSCRFNPGDSSKLSQTFGSDGNRRTWTISLWAKRCDFAADACFYGVRSGSDDFMIRFNGGTTPTVSMYNGGTSPVANVLLSDAIYRDASAWYHIVYGVDTTQSVDTDRCKMYVNGIQITDLNASETNYPAINTEWQIGSTTTQYISADGGGSSMHFNGYLAEYHYVNGLQLTPSSFGETNEDTNQWVPIKYSGAYGTNGFYLKFQDSASLGDDSSGNGNDWTSSGLTAADQMLDTPTNNFATFNPIDNYYAASTFTEGNLEVATASGNVYAGASSTIKLMNGYKWYWETYVVSAATNWLHIGIRQYTPSSATDGIGYNVAPGATTSWAYVGNDGDWYQNNSGTTYGDTYTAGDVIGVAVDLENNKLYFSKNGVWQDSGVPTSGATGTGAIAIGDFDYFAAIGTTTGDSLGFCANFGSDSSFAGNLTAQGNQDANEVGDFYYDVPAEYLALCSSNLPEPAIVLPEPYFEILTATGDGTSSKTYSGLEFQPDFVWAKDYDGTAQDADHQWMDVLRGADQILRCNDASQEYDGSTSFGGGSLRTFTSDGFTVEEGTSNNNNLNTSGDSIIAYNWKAGGTGVANTEGSISSTVSANTTSGFSMATFTSNNTAGATVGHGLTQAPEMIFTKIRDDGTSWISGSTSMADTTPWGWAWSINHHHAWANRDEEWYDTTPGASVFTLGAYGSNVGSHPVIAYCFHSVEGYSKIGHYIGNGNVDGPFMYTGFRPSFVILKGNGTNLHNHMLDNKRFTYNPVGVTTGPEPGLATDDAEVPSGEGSGHIDFLSNGFKIRNNNGNDNDNTTRFIYIAFAESPFKTSNAR